MPARERNLILGSLLGLAAVAWVLLAFQAQRLSGDMAAPGGLTMGMAAPLFMAMWVAMMAAMMFPTAAPMILTFSRVQAGKQQQGRPFVPTWVFVSAYLLLWTLFGAAAFAAAIGAESLAARSMWLAENGGRAGGVLLALAGLYQLSPLKGACLSKCRTPITFIITSWQDGYGGAFRMGLRHGTYCLGCCWLLFLILFPLGVMNIIAMALITALIFAEKSLPAAPATVRLAALALLAYGVLAAIAPEVLPAAARAPMEM